MLDIQKARIVHDWTYERPLLAARIDPQGQFVITSGENGLLQKFSIPAGEVQVFPQVHQSWIQGLAIDPAGKIAVSGGGDGKIVWWDLSSSPPAVIRTVDAHQGWVRTLAISPDGRLLASGGYDAKVHLFELGSGQLIRTWTDHAMNVYAVRFFPDNRRLATGDLKGVIAIRDCESDQPPVSLDGAPLHSFNEGQKVNFGGVRCLAIDPQMQYLAAGGLHKSSNPLGAVHEPLALQFSIADQKLLHSHVAEGIPGGGLWNLHYLPDGHLLGVSGGSTGGFLLFWKLGQDLTVHKFQLPALARDMDVTTNGQLVVTSHHDRHVRITTLA